MPVHYRAVVFSDLTVTQGSSQVRLLYATDEGTCLVFHSMVPVQVSESRDGKVRSLVGGFLKSLCIHNSYLSRQLGGKDHPRPIDCGVFAFR